ncbi:hypothetical protein KFL_012680010 [Klebsormidium nitens]|uniref:Uncharacterized protein n=1 Tax=Klebsormidium nitens TaxID=105231 RepID=A0A1Y1IVX2_KLENI|nr:hypothetical protein KFL_012680010 [Klebsormidium nitens]|eukprot:GAQ93046.1 hypothetical protein KFL_012680010 [Klebsormidium nitens]
MAATLAPADWRKLREDQKVYAIRGAPGLRLEGNDGTQHLQRCIKTFIEEGTHFTLTTEDLYRPRIKPERVMRSIVLDLTFLEKRPARLPIEPDFGWPDMEFFQSPDRTLVPLCERIAEGAYPKLWGIDFSTPSLYPMSTEFFRHILKVLKSPNVRLQYMGIPSHLGEELSHELLDALEGNRKLLILFYEWPEKSMAARAELLLDRNWQLLGLAREALSAASAGKLLLCGEGRVGKTTLRKTLWPPAVNQGEQKQLGGNESGGVKGKEAAKQRGNLLAGLRSKLVLCFRPEDNSVSDAAGKKAGSKQRGEAMIGSGKSGGSFGGVIEEQTVAAGLSNLRPEASTRGWEVERVKWEDYTMMLVDCAGQEEYQVLHSFIIPEIASQATVFVLVCDGTEVSSLKARAQLIYWLQYLVSSSRMARAVKVIVNEREGRACEGWWGQLLGELSVTFGERVLFLGGTEPFFLDAKKPSVFQASRLRDELQGHLTILLKDIPGVPVLANTMLEALRGEAKLKANLRIATWPEVGEIVYVERPHRPNSDQLVILDSEWFGRKVAGELLFPERLWSDKDPEKRKRDGFAVNGQLKLKEIAKCWAGILQSTAFTAETLMDVLVDLELCYWLDATKKTVLIPPFLPARPLVETAWADPSSGSSGRGDGQVVGRQLRCAAPSEDAANASTSSTTAAAHADGAAPSLTLLPVSILYLLQVQWHAKSSPGRSPTTGRRKTCWTWWAELVTNVIEVCARRLPGVTLLEEAVFAADASEDVLASTRCKSVAEIELEVARKPDVIFGREILGAKLLTKEELGTILTRQQKAHQSALELSALVLGGKLDPDEEGVSAAKAVDQTGPNAPVLRAIRLMSMRLNGKLNELTSLVTQHHVEVMREFRALRSGQEELLEKLRSLQTFLETKDFLPRFVHLVPGRTGFLRQTLALHVLCEGEIVPHRVAGKEAGKEVKVTQEWVREMAPWLKTSLKLLVVFAKIGVNIAAPGAGTLIPGVEALQGIFGGTPLDAVVRGYTAKEIVDLVDKKVDSLVAFVEGTDTVNVETDPGVDTQARARKLLSAVSVGRDDLPGQFGLSAVKFIRDCKPNNKAGQLAWSQSGCLTECVICDAPETDEAFTGFEVADRSEPARAWGARPAREQSCHWCWVDGARERWESEQAAGTGAQLRELFREGAIAELD